MSVLNRLIRRLPSRRRQPVATSVFADTVQAGEIWERRRQSATRWGLWGAILGVAAGAVVFAPASWLAAALARATDDRLVLAEARGTVWSGSAIVVLGGGNGSHDAASLPGRLSWTLGVQGRALAITATHACCLFGPTTVKLEPGLGTHALVLPSAPGGLGQWPAAVLSGLGTPWNTLQLGGTLRLSTPDARIEWLQGRWRLDGQVQLDLNGISSRVSTLDELGSYRVQISGRSGSSDSTSLQLNTTNGALQVSGQGQWVGAKLRFRGEAAAAEGSENALNNLLNIIGRRQGTRSIISIG
jgi:general secretion pathway protein N